MKKVSHYFSKVAERVTLQVIRRHFTERGGSPGNGGLQLAVPLDLGVYTPAIGGDTHSWRVPDAGRIAASH